MALATPDLFIDTCALRIMLRSVKPWMGHMTKILTVVNPENEVHGMTRKKATTMPRNGSNQVLGGNFTKINIVSGGW